MTGLTFGVDTIIDLASDEPIGIDGYVFEASSAEDGADWGNPEAVITEIQSQLLDGSLGKITSFDNRTATVPLRIKAIDMDTLADAEAALMGEVYRDGWNQLVWTPPAASVSTVFDVVYADLQFKLDDLDEHRCIRNYTLTLTCLPRPRSADLVSVESLPVPPATSTTVTVDDCSSTTGWSSTTGTVTESGGTVTTHLLNAASVNLIRTGAIDLSATPYLVITGTATHPSGGPAVPLLFEVDGVSVTPTSFGFVDTSWTAVLFLTTSVEQTLEITNTGPAGLPAISLAVGNINRTNQPFSSSPRQQSRSLIVHGSARTQASLRVETAEAELGPETLVFSAPPQASGFQPPLRTHRVGGPTATTSTTAASGATNALATSQASADHWSISTTVIQAATYELCALLSVAATKTVTLSWQASGTTAGVPTVTGSRTVTLAAGYQFVSVGSIDLPTARAYAGSSDDVQLWLWASATGVTIDDGYLFSGEGHLSIIGTTGCSLLLLNSASIDDPEATAWVGKAAGSSGGDPDADTGVVYAGNRAQAWEQHQFAPPATNVFVVTPGTTKAQVSMTYYPRWGHHAAWVAA